MRRIKKTPAPMFFIEWRSGRAADWKPSWGALDSDTPTKQKLKKALCEEQFYLCCYCESRVEATPQSSLIEHLDPKSRHPDSDVTYGNLLASCTRKGTCGDKKAALALPVTPLEEDCDRAFRYQVSGDVKAADGFGRKQAAERALEVLGLNRNVELREKRAAAIDGLYHLDDFGLRQLKHFLESEPEKAREFDTAIRQHLQKLLPLSR